MKKIIVFFAAAFSCLILSAQKDSASKLNGLFKKANSIFTSGKGSGSLTNAEISSGLKEALTIGAQKSADKLSLTDGFFKDAAVKILMPAGVSKVESKLRMLGMGKLFDKTILSLNRAAEDASRSAAPIFIEAIKKITLQDALHILRGTDTAATFYLRKATTEQLTAAFMPVVEASLSNLNATEYWNEFFSAYNRVSVVKVDADINSYVTAKALDGLFYYVGAEEKKIRTNPAERVSDVLKKVFAK